MRKQGMYKGDIALHRNHGINTAVIHVVTSLTSKRLKTSQATRYTRRYESPHMYSATEQESKFSF